MSALRFYEAQALIRSHRTAGNQRRYAREMLRRVAVIKTAQRLGVALSEVRAALVRLPEGRTPTAADWRAMSGHWKGLLTRRIEALTRLRDQLDGCIGCGCLSLEACPLRNPLDRLSDEGPGARLFERP